MLASIVLAVTVGVSAPKPAPVAIPLIQLRAGQPLSYAIVSEGSCASTGSAHATPVSQGAFDRVVLRTDASRIVLFVPGFATSETLAYTAARRIQSVLGRRDEVVMVDWGSAGKRTRYETDARTARRNAPQLVTALQSLHDDAARREIDIFAHSLGTRVVAMAIARVTGTRKPLVADAVLAAPDMTIADYQRAIERVPGPVGRVTIYASRGDRALLLSEIIHLHRRLGLITHWRRALASTDIVDASTASQGLDGHGYAITEPALIADIGETLAGDAVPHPNWHPRQNGPATTWAFVPPRAAQPAATPLKTQPRECKDK